MANSKNCTLKYKATKKISWALPLFSIFGSAFCSHTFAQNITQQKNLNEKTLIAQQTTPPQETEKNSEKLDPTQDVAGGVGEKGFQAPKYAVLPTGKTLPKGIFKVDVPAVYTFGGQGFDGSGKQVDNGLSMNRWITGALIQYGVSNTVSIGIGIPYVASYQMSMNGNTLAANSEMYHRYYDRFIDDLSAKLIANNGFACGGNATQAACANYINGGGSLPTSVQANLPTGEQVTFNSSSPIKDQIRNVLLTASQPSNGASGLGDIQLGILWNVISEESPIRHMPLYISVGGGLRIPTGKFNIVSATRATGGDGTLITGGGTYDAILRWNVDYIFTPGVILSWQHQAEYSLTDANLGRTSMLNNNNFNTADPNSNGGDGQSNTLTFSRKGLHHIGFLQAAWGLGNVTESLKWLGLYTQAKYNIAAKSFLNGQPVYLLGDQFFLGESSMHPDHGPEQYYSVAFGTKVSGLPYRIPAEVTAEVEYPYAGKNRAVSPMNAKAIFTFYF